MAAFWGALYTIARWIYEFAAFPVHEDVRYDYVAGQAALRYGWARIYDFDTLRTLSAGLPQASINPGATYISPPLLALIFTPLTLVPEPIAYLTWTVISLAALVLAWYLVAPFAGIAKLTMLLAGLALWPMYLALFYGQPTLIVLALVAVAWWLLRRQRPVLAGLALSLATMLKPQVVIFLPLVLLASGRLRPVVSWAVFSFGLAAGSALLLGESGLRTYWSALGLVESDPQHSYFTVAYLFGASSLTYALMLIQAAACVFVAWKRQGNLDVVFALGLLGSLMASIHLHQPDYCNLLLAAWLVLRGTPSLAHRAWLAVGFVTMQILTIGLPWPQLVWDVVWLAFLGFEPQDAEEKAREHRLHAEGQQHGGRDDLAHRQARV